MPDETTAAVTDAEPSIDIDKVSDEIGADLFSDTRESPKEAVTEAVVASEKPTGPIATPPVAVPPLLDANAPPKSWPKDMHTHWATVPQPVRDYYQQREKQFLDGLEQYKGAAQSGKAMQEALAPYQPLLQSKGLDAPAAIHDLLGAYSRLTQGTPEQRTAALWQLAQNLQIPLPAQAATGTNGNTPQADPRLQTIEQQLQQMQQALTAQQQAALTAAREKASQEVAAFASEVNKDGTPTHAFFDEVHEDLIRFLKQGDTLQDAYDKAVWVNPVVREKQMQARVQTETEKALERKRLDALPKEKARGVNVNSRDTQRTPTDPLGSMEDTLRSTFREIKGRTVH